MGNIARDIWNMLPITKKMDWSKLDVSRDTEALDAMACYDAAVGNYGTIGPMGSNLALCPSYRNIIREWVHILGGLVRFEDGIMGLKSRAPYSIGA